MNFTAHHYVQTMDVIAFHHPRNNTNISSKLGRFKLKNSSYIQQNTVYLNLSTHIIEYSGMNMDRDKNDILVQRKEQEKLC